MQDREFIGQINAIAKAVDLRFPPLAAGETPEGNLLDEWARFLEECVKAGIPLSDPRWRSLSLEHCGPPALFRLDPVQSAAAETPSDADFRVGLKLLIGMLGPVEDDTGT